MNANTPTGTVISTKSQDSIDRASALLKTAWLAMVSGAMDPEDVIDIADTVYEALSRIEGVKAELRNAHDVAIADAAKALKMKVAA